MQTNAQFQATTAVQTLTSFLPTVVSRVQVKKRQNMQTANLHLEEIARIFLGRHQQYVEQCRTVICCHGYMTHDTINVIVMLH